MPEKVKNIRFAEVTTGILLILGVTGMLLAMLSDFSLVTPYSSLQEDMTYLPDSIESLRISGLIRLICGFLTLVLLPFFLSTFSHHTRVYHYINGVLILMISTYYFITGGLGFRMISLIRQLSPEFIAGTDNAGLTSLLQLIRLQQNLVVAGRILIGLFLIIFTFSKIKARRIPFVSSLLFILSGPVIVFFSWYDPENLALTSAMATGALGMVILGLRLINKGLMTLPRRLRKMLKKEKD
ncbi:MAG: hypothetical protein ACOYXB_02660 [Bacteroidota bacterium]